MPERAFHLEVKSIDTEAEGSFSGFASTYGNLDSAGDIVCVGAFSETLRKGNERPILWAHDSSEPCGLASLEDSAVGLKIEGQLDLDTEAGRNAHSRLRKRIVRGLSIGYRTVKDTVKDGARHLQQLELFEVSLCCFPANPAAQVVRVKSQLRSIKDYEQWLRATGGFSKSESKRLAAHGWQHGPDDDDDDEEDEDLLTWLRAQKAAALAP